MSHWVSGCCYTTLRHGTGSKEMETREIYPPISSTGKNIKEYFRNTLPGHIYQKFALFHLYAGLNYVLHL